MKPSIKPKKYLFFKIGWPWTNCPCTEVDLDVFWCFCSHSQNAGITEWFMQCEEMNQGDMCMFAEHFTDWASYIFSLSTFYIVRGLCFGQYSQFFTMGFHLTSRCSLTVGWPVSTSQVLELWAHFLTHVFEFVGSLVLLPSCLLN